jgi:hypothetical protein
MALPQEYLIRPVDRRGLHRGGRGQRQRRSDASGLVLLVAVDADLSDAGTVAWAATRARARGARLTVLCAWRPTALLALVALTDENPWALLDQHERAAARWLREQLRSVTPDVSVMSRCCRGRLAAAVNEELGSGAYAELIADAALSRAGRDRVLRKHPDIPITSAPPSRDPLLRRHPVKCIM